MSEAYCFKCRRKRKIKEPKQVNLKNGRLAMQGTCSACGTKVFRMLRGSQTDEGPTWDQLQRIQREERKRLEQFEAGRLKETFMRDPSEWPHWPPRP